MADQEPKKKWRPGCFTILFLAIIVLIPIVKLSNYLEERAKIREVREQAEIAAQAEKDRIEQARIEKKKIEAERSVFDQEIETHRKMVVDAIEARDYEKANDSLAPFVKYDRLGYKDIAVLKRMVDAEILLKKVKALPASKTSENLELYEKLAQLDPKNKLYKNKVAHYRAQYEKEARIEARRRQMAQCDLHLLSWHWSQEYRHAIAKGEVKNISGRKLERVQALVTWYDRNGSMITSDDALIEFDPIMPGQTSPFEVIENYNPAMANAKIEFKSMWGPIIQTYHGK